MKKISLLFAILCCFCGKAYAGFDVGTASLSALLPSPNVAVTQLNATNTWIAASFVPDATKTVSSIKFPVSAVAGTLDGDDISVSIYSTTTTDGKPNASVASSTTVAATPTGAAVVEATGFSYEVTAGTQYYVVVKNAAAVPATNNFTVRRYTSFSFTGSNSAFGYLYTSSTDGGSTWSSPLGGVMMAQMIYSDSSVKNILFENNTLTTGAYGTGGTRRIEGISVTTPANAKIKVRGFFINLAKNGTPTGALTAKMRVGGSTYTAVNVLQPGQVNGFTHFYLSTAVSVLASTEIKLTFENGATDSSSNCYRIAYYVIDDTAANKALIPMLTKFTYSADDGTTWTNTDDYVPVGGLLLESNDFFDTTSSGTSGGAYVF